MQLLTRDHAGLYFHKFFDENLKEMLQGMNGLVFVS